MALDAQGKRLPYVFTHNGRPVKSIKRVFARVRQETGIRIGSSMISAIRPRPIYGVPVWMR
jgi:hypothetical protein